MKNTYKRVPFDVVLKTGQPKDIWFELLKVGDTVFTGYDNEIIRKKYGSFMIGFDANGRDNTSDDGFYPIAVSGLTPPIPIYKLLMVKLLHNFYAYRLLHKYQHRIEEEFRNKYSIWKYGNK